MKVFTIIVSTIAVTPAFSTMAELPSNLRRLNATNATGHSGGYGHEGGHHGGHGHEGGHEGGYGHEGGHQGGYGQEGGHQGGYGQEGGCGQGGYGYGVEGHDGGMYGFGEDRPDLVVIQCNTTDACDLRNGEVGTWACRTMMTDPVTGESRSHAICIPNDRAWTTDECGCCKDDTGINLECPLRPEFITMQCANDTQPDPADAMIHRHGNRRGGDCQDQNRTNFGFQDGQFVCRDHFNPFTGETQPKTLFVPEDQAMEGDTCGCCDGKCPFSEETTNTTSDPLGSTEQALESAGNLNRLNGVIFFTMLAAVVLQSLW